MSEPADGPVPEGLPEPSLRRPRVLVLVALGVAALAAVLVVLLEPTLFGGTVLDPAGVERDVAAQFEQREGVAVTLECPRTMALVRGRSYRCAGTTATGENVPIRIVVTRTSPAAYSWTLR